MLKKQVVISFARVDSKLAYYLSVQSIIVINITTSINKHADYIVIICKIKANERNRLMKKQIHWHNTHKVADSLLVECYACTVVYKRMPFWRFRQNKEEKTFYFQCL